MDRPARCQISQEALNDFATERSLDLQASQGPNAVLNTWYRKWSGGAQNHQQTLSPFRCHLEQDSGITKVREPYICLWFSRGACYKGPECSYLHRAPIESDAFVIDGTTDCFGRIKYAANREDMGGVGTLLSTNKTLFVGYFKSSDKNLASTVKKQFSEWGAIEKVRFGKNNSIAFVTYKMQLSAEFAKEAMSNQSITGSEVLSIRWAHQQLKSQNTDTAIDDQRLREIVRQALKNQHAERKSISTDASNDAENDNDNDNDYDNDGRPMKKIKT